MKKLLELISENNGQLSSIRFLSFAVVGAFIVEWMRFAFTHDIAYTPSWETVVLIGGILGLKVFQKNIENGTKSNSGVQ